MDFPNGFTSCNLSIYLKLIIIPTDFLFLFKPDMSQRDDEGICVDIARLEENYQGQVLTDAEAKLHCIGHPNFLFHNCNLSCSILQSDIYVLLPKFT